MILFWHIKAKSWVETTFSKTLLKKGSSEIGLKWLKTEGSRLGFFKRGCTTVCLKIEGKSQFSKELLIINKILGPTISITIMQDSPLNLQSKS